MKNDKLMFFLMPIMLVLLVAISYLKIVNNEKIESNDANKFKSEYEQLNNQDYLKIEINENNPIKYADYDKLLEVIDKETGIIYLGFPECPWCRNMVPVLLDVAKDNNIDTIYYMNIANERDSYVVEDGKLVYSKDSNGNEKKGTKGYFKLLEALDEHLTDYTILFEDKKYEVGEKRIYAPSVIFVKEGEILGVHVSTVVSQENPKKELTKEQYEELYVIYDDYIIELSDNTCSVGSSC